MAEFSDLSSADRTHCMDVVAQLEQALRKHLQPTKINLAALGNMVPHLHWHVIARLTGTATFLRCGQRRNRERALDDEAAVRARLPAMEAQLGGYLG